MMSSCLWFTLQDVFRKDSEIESDTYYHYESYGHFTASIDRGGLNIPGDTVCEWCFMCYILFSFIGASKICRYSLASFFVDIAFINSFESINRTHSNTLANIFLNNFLSYTKSYIRQGAKAESVEAV